MPRRPTSSCERRPSAKIRLSRCVSEIVAVDAIVAAALAGAVAAPHQTGPGGYGMTAIVAINGRQIAAIDGNSAAPVAMTRDFFKTDSQGRVPGRVNHTGWLAAGIPGVLAGLQKLLDEFGTRKFGELAQPAIRIARDHCSFPTANRSNRANGSAIRPWRKCYQRSRPQTP